ncbi:U1A small nuclear ribonucleoprotein [Novymonas esmeraldas]|uniref:U1A small nuclear ribonucleoprotein n=1 Tax=Novymonas esmeraldas TaxID=1808958 RepID=A0AAW0FBG9_9TRYP
MEFIEVSNVTFPVGTEHTRRTLLRLFELVRPVEDIVLDVQQGRGMVCFAESAAAQEALVSLDGILLFGRALCLRISPPPASPMRGYIVTTRPSRYLLVRNVPYLVVVVKLRHIAGVVSVTSAGVNSCFVVAASAGETALLREVLLSHPSRWGSPVSVSHLRRLS